MRTTTTRALIWILFENFVCSLGRCVFKMERVIKCFLYIDLRGVRGLISCSLNNRFHRSFLNIVILKLDAFMAISSIILRDRCRYILRKFLAC